MSEEKTSITDAEELGDPASPHSESAPRKKKDHFDVPAVHIQFKNLILGSKLNILLLVVPFSYIAVLLDWSNIAIFFLNFLALIPLAAMLGDFTEDLSLRSNEAIGALINVTFGNATELIISIFALKAGMFDVIKQSLVGSVLGNMLLVLGCSFIAGGVKQSQTKFNATAANVYCSLLLLSTMSFVIPTAFVQLHTNPQDILHVSRQIAIVTFLTYIAYILFQLVTHKSLFDGEAGDDDDEEEEEPQFSFVFAFIGTGVVGVLISFGSEFIIGSIEGAAREWGVSKHFLSVILLPIVGNAAEHATAVTQGYKGNMDIALGVAIGSSIQISSFVVPMMVIVSWMMNLTLDLNFHPFSTAILFVSVITTNSLVFDGKSHWLEGLMLLSAYLMLMIAFIYAPDKE
eukprot:PhF_6_TR25310/c0_g1_i1/m.34942/K07300/chaA, CAX; Ca2+:H+ antiporter